MVHATAVEAWAAGNPRRAAVKYVCGNIFLCPYLFLSQHHTYS
jgi:hypothetical protein